MSQAWKRVWKRDDEVRTLSNIWDNWCGCQQMCRQIMAVLLHMCSGCPAEIIEQTIVMSLYGVTRFSHAIEGGNYKKRPWPSLGAAAITVIWVFGQVFGSLLSHRPSTLLSWCPSSRKHTQDVECGLFFHKHASRPIWRTLSYCDFIYLMATGQTTTSSSWTWYWVKCGSQPFGSKLQGWDKMLAWCESLPVYLVYLCNPTKCGPVTFLASLGVLQFSAPFLPRRESQIWFSSGSCNGIATVSLNWRAWWLLEVSGYLSPWLEASPHL